jgi:excisionase family DNA binding protein
MSSSSESLALLLTVSQAAEILGMSRAHVYRQLRSGGLPFELLHIGGCSRLRRSEIETYARADGRAEQAPKQRGRDA